jgi:hypothetical protein
MSRKKYNAIQEQHIARIEAWISEDPARWDDADRTFREYCDEYSYRFAIAAHRAADLDYPENLIEQMLEELGQFESWFEK